MIGSIFFAGVITTIIVIPWLADRIGRKWIFVTSYFVFILVCVGILFATNIYWLYVFVFISGTTFAGRIVVALIYLIEFQ